MPCHLEIALKGLKALKVLNDLKAVRFELPSTARLKTETKTMTKSRQVQTLLK